MSSNHIEVWRECLVGQRLKLPGLAKLDGQQTVGRCSGSPQEKVTSRAEECTEETTGTMTPTRHWIRNVSHLAALNSHALERAIEKKLEKAYPAELYPFDILVAYTWVQITDYSGIDEKQTVPTAVDQ
jgi:hypothetical protein